MSFGSLRQLAHQFKSFGANALQFCHARGISLLLRQAKIGQADGIEIVVGERDESKSPAAQIDDLSHHHVGSSRPRLLAIGAPHGAERTMLRTTADGLHGSPHVFVARSQVPARRQELVAGDSATVIDSLSGSGEQIRDHFPPDHIPVALHDGVGAAKFHGFIGIQGGVDAAIHHVSAAFASDFRPTPCHAKHCQCGCRFRRHLRVRSSPAGMAPVFRL